MTEPSPDRPDGARWTITEPGGSEPAIEVRWQQYCARCGEQASHPACDAALALEPPRYCAACGRRMIVQIVPTGWTARCVEHGELTGGNAT